ncbi:HAD family hydrolase [Leptolyngbya ohadii]|uniref:HAD family hydrolase n=1 Tax=Leptolyngbya ohadii TaxID=1962290 RepID=UPI000B59AA63|nr:HAD family hydrolase [Leptolyngbya ohadii]
MTSHSLLSSSHSPTLLALDFDGVICDGLLEYFQTAWRSYCRIWSPVDKTPPEELAERFYRLRPVVETGWEMPCVLRSILQGTSEADILKNWSAICLDLVQTEELVPGEVEQLVDCVRDEWITADLTGWLSLHRFYPGVVPLLQRIATSGIELYIVTTKEDRFVQQLLAQSGVDLPASRIFGKSVRQPKAQTLRQLQKQSAESVIWFVEDRLKTLQTIASQVDLQDVQLFLADWGYNTAADRTAAGQDDRIHLLTLEQFAHFPLRWI